ncbi:AMP-binding protein [Streptomyces spiralis]
MAHLLYTSGIADRPKGSMQTHATRLFNDRIVRERLGGRSDERTLIAAPMFRATGVVPQFVGFFTGGGCCVSTRASRRDRGGADGTRTDHLLRGVSSATFGA